MVKRVWGSKLDAAGLQACSSEGRPWPEKLVSGSVKCGRGMSKGMCYSVCLTHAEYVWNIYLCNNVNTYFLFVSMDIP